MAVRTDRGAMISRSRIRCRLFAFIFLAAACSSNTGPNPPPPPPPPPPPGAVTVTAPRKDSVPTGAPLQLEATFQDTASKGSPWSYTIDWGDGANSNGTKSSITPITETHAFASEASYSVKITVTNHLGAAGTASVPVTAMAPVILAAGDVSDCTRTSDDSVANLLDTLEGVVMPLGDNAYESGTPQQYADCYGPTWGRQKGRTHPVAGNHDYYDTSSTGAIGPYGYFGYFGAAAGDPAKGYYDYAIGSWLVIVLNTGSDSPPNYAAGSPQEQWLRAELASHSQQCVVAMWHHPRFSSIAGRAPIRPEVGPLWDALYQYGADLVLNGHDHAYQRFAPQKPDGTLDATFGIREIAVGTGGGETLYDLGPTVPNLEVRNNTTHGVLKLTLRAGGYDWRFIPVPGETFTDSGTGTCHGRPS